MTPTDSSEYIKTPPAPALPGGSLSSFPYGEELIRKSLSQMIKSSRRLLVTVSEARTQDYTNRKLTGISGRRYYQDDLFLERIGKRRATVVVPMFAPVGILDSKSDSESTCSDSDISERDRGSEKSSIDSVRALPLPTPVCVHFAGSGYMGGINKASHYIGERVASEGITMVIVGSSSSPEYSAEELNMMWVEEAKEAIVQLHRKGFDVSKIIVSGFSCGANGALMLASEDLSELVEGGVQVSFLKMVSPVCNYHPIKLDEEERSPGRAYSYASEDVVIKDHEMEKAFKGIDISKERRSAEDIRKFKRFLQSAQKMYLEGTDRGKLSPAELIKKCERLIRDKRAFILNDEEIMDKIIARNPDIRIILTRANKDETVQMDSQLIHSRALRAGIPIVRMEFDSSSHAVFWRNACFIGDSIALFQLIGMMTIAKPDLRDYVFKKIFMSEEETKLNENISYGGICLLNSLPEESKGLFRMPLLLSVLKIYRFSSSHPAEDFAGTPEGRSISTPPLTPSTAETTSRRRPVLLRRGREKSGKKRKRLNAASVESVEPTEPIAYRTRRRISAT